MQVIVVIMCFYTVLLIDVLYNKKNTKRYIIAYGPASILIIMFTGFLAFTSYQSFGRVVISTQAAINLYQGHSPYAKGGWTLLLWQQHKTELDTLIKANMDKLSGSEYDETQVYKKWAISWIKEHPVDEIKLIIKKTALFFSPYNSNHLKIDPFTLLVNLFFLCCVASIILTRSKDIEFYYLLSPVLAIYMVNIVYYVEFRWRYMADPFILLLACIFVVYYIAPGLKTKEAQA